MTTTNLPTHATSVLAGLFPTYQQRACRYAYWILGNSSDCEEVVQEAYCRLAQRERNGKPIADEKSFAGLLFTTVRNLSIDRLRKSRRAKQLDSDAAMQLADRSDDSTSVAALQQEVTRLIDRLPHNWGEALKLRIVGDLSYEEISQVLGCTRQQVRTWIYRARKQIADKLTRDGWLESIR